MRSCRHALASLILVVAACGGATTSTRSSPPTPSSPPSPSPSASTKLVADIDIGGRTMRLVCAGPTDREEPTILLEAGLGLDHHTWRDVLPLMESTHRLCGYDRAGVGQSQRPKEASRTAADQVADLHALLDGASVDGPIVIAAHSYGAIVATLYTHTYPADVVGLLFVDPRGPHVSAGWREALPAPAADEPASVTAFRDFLDSETEPSLNRERLHLQDSAAEAAAALDAAGPLFADRPLVVLRAGLTPDVGLPPDLAATINELWAAGQQRLVDESTAGSLETVSGAGHEIQVQRPQAVVDALERILDDLEGG